MNDKPMFDTNVILYAFRQGDTRVQLAETLLAREEHYQFRCLMNSSLWRGASLTRAGRKFAAPSTYFVSFVQSPCLFRSRPTSEPYTLPSDTGILSLIHSSSRLRWMLAPAHFTQRTCEMARRSTGL